MSRLKYYMVEITAEEAMCVDYVLTLHSFEETALAWYRHAEPKAIRRKTGKVIVRGKDETISLTEDEMEILLVFIPITFRFGQTDVGLSLKRKLYKAYLGVEDEQPESNSSNTGSPAQNNPENPPTDFAYA